MASGRILFDHRLYKEALSSFRRAAQIRPVKVKPHFQEGNTLFALGRITEAREAYNSALQAAEEDSDCLVPQIHVNLGIALESEGMLLGATEHYKEAAIKEPKHYRALKLLGSALYGVGEYRAAKEALLEAISLNPDYADAHCELGSVLHALGDHDEASAEFERALELRPNHIEALYNLATLLKDIGRYQKAAMLYQKILILQEDHWRAQLNRAVSLLGAGDIDESRRAFKEAYKMTGRSELHDAIAHLQQMENGHQGLLSFFKGGDTNFGVVSNDIMAKDNFIVVEPTRFRRVNAKTTPRQLLAFALDVRQFQKHTRFNRCDVSNLKRELSQVLLPNPSQQTIVSEKMIRKDALENIVHSLLSFLKPEAFQGAIKLVNERILLPIDSTASGRVDLGMVFSVFALICGGSLERRKRVAFDALVFRSPRTIDGEISNKDLKDYIKLLRIAYLRTKDEINSNDNVTEDHTTLSFPEFAEVLDDPDSGFGILNILSKLEMEDHVRHGRHLCAVCCYPITGPRFKETKVKFNLCSLCYSSGKVPSSSKHEENYHFKELNGETNTVKEKLQNYRQPFKSCLQE
ncbi:hypothetical protein KP509_38G035400 [Ceratopteris richardii]|nr:hypothetical protein KP509_38G035400 [Ceratopteris richardii]